MLADGQLYCDLIDFHTGEILDSVSVSEGIDIIFRPMDRHVEVAIQFRLSPILAVVPVQMDRADKLIVKDGSWGIHLGAYPTEWSKE